jgi:hypothetical protein
MPPQLNLVRQALERTLKSEEWDDTLLLLGTKELNSCIKKQHYSKDQIAALKMARRRAKNRTYALRSRQKKSGKELAPCPGLAVGGGGGTAAAAVPSRAVSSRAAKIKIKSEVNGSGSTGDGGGAGPGVDVAGGSLSSAAEAIFDEPSRPGAAEYPEDTGWLAEADAEVADMDADDAVEIAQLGQSLRLSLDDDETHSFSSEHWGSNSSIFSDDFSLDGGFTSSTSYDSSIDMLSASLDSQGGSAAYAAAFDAFGSLSLDGVPDYPAPSTDNFLSMVFANIPEDAETDASGAAVPPAAMAAISPEPARGTDRGSTDLELLMLDLRKISSGYDEVHKKMDSMIGLIPTSLEPASPNEHIDTAHLSGDAAIAEPSGRNTPTPMHEGYESLASKIDGWSPDDVGLPESVIGKPPTPHLMFDQATPLSVDGGLFTFDGPTARAEVAEQEARSPQHHSGTATDMATSP